VSVLFFFVYTGTAVQRLPFGLDGEPVEWAGVGAGGSPCAPGAYQFRVENYAEGELLGSSPVESYQRVEEAQMIDGKIILLLAGGQAVSPADIIGLRS